MVAIQRYFAKHVVYNSLVHVLSGMGIGLLLAYPVFEMHTLRFGLLFLGLGVLGHIYPLLLHKK